jgi:exodeoxyribonuclease-3
MRLISWNVNGIRAALKKGFLDFAGDAGADVICLQETRAEPEQAEFELAGYRQFWNPAEKKGYSGTMMLTRVEPLGVRLGIGMKRHESEGRVITLEFPEFFLTNVYTPNAQRELTRLDYRLEWDRDFLKFLKKLEREKPVVFCGDLNVAHQEIDLANPKSNQKNAGFTPEEREGFDRIVKAGFVDTFRAFCPDPGHYTWWSQMGGARARNVGWRIDYFCVSAPLRGRLGSATIQPGVMGSDHCPVLLELE